MCVAALACVTVLVAARAQGEDRAELDVEPRAQPPDAYTVESPASIYLTVRAPGYQSERAEVVIHDGALPTAKLL